jgi:hypothetical protein
MELFNAARQFFTDTAVWREYLNIYVDPNAYDYDLVTASKGVVTTLMSLGKPNDGQTDASSVTAPTVRIGGDFNADFSSDFSGPFSLTPSGAIVDSYDVQGYSRAIAEKSPRRGALVRSGASNAILRIYDLPNVPEVWVSEVALTINDPIDGDGLPFMPAWIADKYFDVLLDGLLSRVMVHPAKPYTNEKGAAFHGRRFMSGIGTARTDVRHGGIYGSQRWRFPQSFATRSQRTA